MRFSLFLILFTISCSDFPQKANAPSLSQKRSPTKVIEEKVFISKPEKNIVKTKFKKIAYLDLIRIYEKERQDLASTWSPSAENKKNIERILLKRFAKLSSRWIGTAWDLGPPQNRIPGPGKINRGTFVGRILNDAGFNVKVEHLQRQPAQLIIQSFVGGRRVKKFSKRSMESFIKSVKKMGYGLYIIGLDFHVGFLRYSKDAGLRFIHSSYESGKVQNEKASEAGPIVSSRYRVVGKIFSSKNIDDWIKGKKIKVKGKW